MTDYIKQQGWHTFHLKAVGLVEDEEGGGGGGDGEEEEERKMRKRYSRKTKHITDIKSNEYERFSVVTSVRKKTLKPWW